MNRNKIAGSVEIAAGAVAESIAVLIGHAEWQRAARRRRTDGRIRFAAGEAQDLIRRSMRDRRNPDVSARARTRWYRGGTGAIDH